MEQYVFGVDIGGTGIKLGRFRRDFTLVERWEIPTDTEDHGARILPQVARAILDNLSKNDLSPTQVLGVGLGVPGPVDADGVVNKCVNLGWGVFNLREELGRLLPQIPRIAVGNDANAAALGELHQGGGKGYRSAVLFTLGTGVGGGVVLDGRIFPGANGAAGEVGHMTVEPNESVTCSCGKYGCLEQYASAKGLVFLAKRLLVQCSTPSPLRALEHFTAKDICDLARGGDALCCAIIDRCGEYLGRAISYVACALDPQVFIVGGGMSAAGPILLDRVAVHYAKYAFHPSANTPILPARLGNDAGIYGGAAMILN